MVQKCHFVGILDLSLLSPGCPKNSVDHQIALKILRLFDIRTVEKEDQREGVN